MSKPVRHPKSDDDLFTTIEAAAHKHVTPATVRRAIREGRLAALESGGIYLIRWGDLKAWQPRNGGRPKVEMTL